MADKIKVVFKRVFVKSDADWFGSGEFYFNVTVDGKKVGDKQTFDARQGKWIDLPEAKWFAEVDLAGKTEVVVVFNGKDEDLFFDDDLGTVRYTLRPPWGQREFSDQTEFFTLEWEVLLMVNGRFEHHPPNEIIACRATAGNATCTTVSGVPIIARFEVHPVRPVPTAAGDLPPRGLPAGPELGVLNGGGTVINPGDPINIVPNPSVLPILTAPGGAAPAAGAPPVADANNAARIEVTFYRPNTLTLTDAELVWTARSIAGGGAAAFLGPPNGLKVMAYGTSAGEVALELRFRGELVSTYRVLVLPIKRIPCRFNLLRGPTAANQPRATEADVLDHLKIANRFLRQVALELVLDSNAHVSNGATATATPGIFQIALTAANVGRTFNVDQNVPDLPATRLNFRDNVLNFAYIHSEVHGYLGGATDYPNSKLAPAVPGGRPQISDNGTPSSSWISHTGVPPDAAADEVKMDLIRGRQRAANKYKKLYAILLSDAIGDPSTLAGKQAYAKVIVHEFGHVLNLGHRPEKPDPTTATGWSANGIFYDGQRHPPLQNLMNWAPAQDTCQDFDLIQARAMREAKLVP